MGTYLNHGFVAEHKSGTKRTGKQGYTTVKQGYIRRLERRRLPCFFLSVQSRVKMCFFSMSLLFVGKNTCQIECQKRRQIECQIDNFWICMSYILPEDMSDYFVRIICQGGAHSKRSNSSFFAKFGVFGLNSFQPARFLNQYLSQDCEDPCCKGVLVRQFVMKQTTDVVFVFVDNNQARSWTLACCWKFHRAVNHHVCRNSCMFAWKSIETLHFFFQ